MGKLLVERLACQFPSLALITVNRGNEYWGVSGNPTIVADRNEREVYRTKILEILPQHRWKVVVDFCAFRRADIGESLPSELWRVVEKYILISSDSVYECIDFDRLEITCVDESASSHIAHSLRKRDRYGYRKFGCENILCELTPRALVLRLPDVLGEFDDTFRFWKLCLSGGRGGDSTIPLAFVYSSDVVGFMLQMLDRVVDKPTVLNLLCSQQPSYHEFSKMVRSMFPSSSPETCAFFPSVEYRKIPLDGALAMSEFGFAPTPLLQVVRLTAEWVKEAEHRFPREYAEVRREVVKKVS